MFNAGETSKTFTFTAASDSVDDDGESVKLGFGTLPSTPVSVTAGTPKETTISITDDDLPSSVSVSYGQSSYTVAEGGGVTVTVELSEDPETTVTIPITATNQSGATTSDYSGVPASVVFNAGETSKNFTFTAASDSADDDGESVKLGFGALPSTPVSVTAGTPDQTTVSITDDDLPSSVAASYLQASYTVAEGSMVTVTVELSEDPERTVTIPITATNQGGATTSDYSGVPASVVFNAGETSKTFTFSATSDSVDDDRESVKLGFGTLPTSPVTVTAGTPSETTVTITDDAVPSVTVSFDQDSHSVIEGDSATVTVTLSADPERTVTIPITATNQDDASADDYSVPTRVVFNSGETEKTFDFDATDDDEDDNDESVKLTFGGLPTAVSEGTTNQTVVNIVDNDGGNDGFDKGFPSEDEVPVTVSFGSATYTVAESDDSTTSDVTENEVTVTVTLSADPERMVTIPVTTTNQGGATTADYSGVPSSVVFNSGETSATFTFTATPDSVDDDGESVLLGFGSLPTGVSAATPDETTVTITDDDLPSSVAVSYGQSTYTVAEGVSVTVTVELSEDPETTVTIPVTATNQSGATTSDYSGVPASVVFNAGETSKTFTFTAASDSVDDDGESVKLGFGTLPTSPVTVTAGTPSETTVTITDDDVPSVTVSYGSATYTVMESDDSTTSDVTENEVTVTVTLSADPERTVSIPITAVNQGGASSSDYSGVPASVVFNSGETSATFTFTATSDSVDDDGESVKLGFGNLPTGVSAGTPDESTVSITDDDLTSSVAASYGQASYTVAEGVSVTVTVELSEDPETTVTIPLTTVDQGGASSSDYSGVPSSVVFNAGETSKTFTFTAAADSVDDDGESVKLGFGTLPTSPVTVTAGTPSESTVTITDDDAPSVTVSYGSATYTVAESDDSTTSDVTENEVTVTVTLSADPERTVSIPITAVNQGGASSSDYSGVPASVVFNSGETSATFTFTATSDSVDDDGESVKLGFGTLPTGVSAGTPDESTVSITDDDLPSSVAASYGQGSYTVAEGVSVTVTVELSEDPETTVTIPLTTVDQGGASSSDYSGVPSSVVFNAGETSKTFTFTAASDSVDDDGESVKLGFGTLPSTPVSVTAGTPNESTISITDDDVPSVTVSFGVASYTVMEGSAVTVTVTLSADPERTVSIPVTVTNQGGASSLDYSGVPANVMFDAGETSKRFTFMATQDQDDEDNEQVSVSFGTLPSEVSAGTPSQTTVTIVDSLRVSFGASRYEAYEGGSGAQVVVELDETATTVTTIPINLTLINGVINDDFSGVPSEVVFRVGERSTSFTVTAADDNVEDDGEMIELRFGTLPAGVVNGNPSTTLVELMNMEVPEPNRYVCPPNAGYRIVLDSVGEISQTEEIDYWRVNLDPHRTYFIEVLGKHNGQDVMGQDTYPGDLTLEYPVIRGIWDDGRNRKIQGSRNGNRFSVTKGSTESGWQEIEVRGRGGTGTYQIKVRINDICTNVNGYEHYRYNGGPDGYVDDVAADKTTRLELMTSYSTEWRSVIGFLGDNWSWYRENEPDVDWVRVHLRSGYEYTIELWADEEFPVRHQATDLKILGIHDANGGLILGTPGTTSGKKVTVTFEPAADGEYYVAVGSGEEDRTGTYRISISGRAVN